MKTIILIIAMLLISCSHQTLPEGYNILCNDRGDYLLTKGDWMSEKRFIRKSHAIAYANKWEDLHNIERWQECDKVE